MIVGLGLCILFWVSAKRFFVKQGCKHILTFQFQFNSQIKDCSQPAFDSTLVQMYNAVPDYLVSYFAEQGAKTFCLLFRFHSKCCCERITDLMEQMNFVESDVETTRAQESYQDSSRSWVVCFVNFLAGFVCFGIHCNFGFMHRWLILVYSSGNAVTGMICRKICFCN